MKLTTYNGKTNEIIETELEGDLLMEMENEIKKLSEERANRINSKLQKEAAKAAVLERLGISEQEAELLF